MAAEHLLGAVFVREKLLHVKHFANSDKINIFAQTFKR